MTFPNFRGKHRKDAMVNPNDFIDYAKKKGTHPKIKAPNGVIICYNRELMEYILKNHKTTKIEKGFYRCLYLLDETDGKIGVIGGFGVGAPVATIVLEEMIAYGVKNFISIGHAGTLQKDVDVGSIVVCDRAIRDEGTSFHYIKPSKYAYASKKMLNNIKDSLEGLKRKYVVGTSWTIDAPYRETVEEAKRYQKKGVLTVEMEASALFAVAEYRSVELGCVFTISDSLAELEWKPKFHHKKTKSTTTDLFKLALDVLSK